MKKFPDIDCFTKYTLEDAYLDVSNQILDEASQYVVHCYAECPWAEAVKEFNQKVYHCTYHDWELFLNRIGQLKGINVFVNKDECSVTIRPSKKDTALPEYEFLYAKISYGRYPFVNIQTETKKDEKYIDLTYNHEEKYLFVTTGAEQLSNVHDIIEGLVVPPESEEIYDLIHRIQMVLNNGPEYITESIKSAKIVYNKAKKTLPELESNIKEVMLELNWQSPFKVEWDMYNNDFWLHIGTYQGAFMRYIGDREDAFRQVKPLINYAREYSLLREQYKQFNYIKSL